jgi:AcrR family transcriptional regulator
MGIAERRVREREERRREILLAAWEVAEQKGWSAFSVEQVAAHAELGRATVYGYFDSLQALVVAMAEEAFDALSKQLAAAGELRDALDVPVRFAQANAPGFQLLFPTAGTPRPELEDPTLERLRQDAGRLLGRLSRLARNSGAALPEDAKSAAAFIRGVSMAAAVVPELNASTTLRRRWQAFCLGQGPAQDGVPTPSSESDDRVRNRR